MHPRHVLLLNYSWHWHLTNCHTLIGRAELGWSLLSKYQVLMTLLKNMKIFNVGQDKAQLFGCLFHCYCYLMHFDPFFYKSDCKLVSVLLLFLIYYLSFLYSLLNLYATFLLFTTHWSQMPKLIWLQIKNKNKTQQNKTNIHKPWLPTWTKLEAKGRPRCQRKRSQ